MKTVAQPGVVASLKARVSSVRPDTPRRWGRMTAHEMLCHLGDAMEMALLIRPRTKSVPHRRRAFLKWLILWTPFRFPHGVPTNPQHDPRVDGTKPSAFEKDRERLLLGLDALAAADTSTRLEPAHGLFGLMSVADWQRWAYKHADHHLRQFGA